MSDHDRWPLIEGVYREGFQRFVRVARAVAGDRESAIDAVQEGFVDALRGADQWAGRGPLEGWVWSCVLNRARKARRRNAVFPEASLSTPLPEHDADLGVRLADLPERQRLVIFLRYFADLTYQEIAAAVGIEIGTVSATLHAAHRTLREELKEVRA